MANECNKQCGLFEFMANDVGIKVLHPGGYKSSKELCEMCYIDERSHVLDLACGVGTTAFYISDKYDCRITGIDIAENLIGTAKNDWLKRGSNEKITFEVADALEIPYPDSTFDVVISQAFFVLIDDKDKALAEISRVLKPGGYLGSLELSWFRPPPEEAYTELVSKTCNDLIPNVVTFKEWDLFFKSYGLTHVATSKYPMKSGMFKMLESEGVKNFIRIMLKVMSNAQVKTRMMNVRKTFRKHSEYIGYGIYSYKKKL